MPRWAEVNSVLMISFDETNKVLLRRAAGIGIDLSSHVEAGRLHIEQVDPADLSPGELSGRVRDAVERQNARLVIIDSLTGYMHAMPEEQFVVLQMHEMLTYLNQQGVVTILVLAQHGMVGQMATPIDMTYVSDTVLLLRFFEAHGKLRRAVSVIKKRTGAHEDAIRELRIDSRGLRVGAPLDNFRGVMTGVPTYEGEGAALLKDRKVDGARSALALILAPVGRDAEVAVAILHEVGLPATTCADLQSMLTALGGAGCAVVTEEALLSSDRRHLAEWIRRQPPWSDFPFVLLTSRGGSPDARLPRCSVT